jgi:hypothetical protein
MAERSNNRLMYGFGRGAAASDRDADQGDLCAATRMTQWWQRPNLPK